MFLSTRATLALAFCAIVVQPARAGELRLTFHQGLVTISAADVPVRQILAEWARRGSTRIVNGDKVIGAPVSLELAGVPEKQALEVVLRNVSGYVVGSRAAYEPGLSIFDRIMVMPTSSAPPRAAGPPLAPPQSPVMQPEAPVMEDDQDDPPQPGMGPGPNGEMLPGQQPPQNPNVPPDMDPNAVEPAQPAAPPVLQAPGTIPAPAPVTGQQNNPQAPAVLVSPRPGMLPLPPANPPQ